MVLWHGMGDDCCNVESMGRITALIQRHLGKDTFVHSVKIGDSINDDHNAGFFGQIDQQLDKVCEELSKIPELKHGFNAIGFSQVEKKNLFKQFWLNMPIGWVISKVKIGIKLEKISNKIF